MARRILVSGFGTLGRCAHLHKEIAYLNVLRCA
ncbi:hypothetical protein SIID45300_02146 [Candidatus Magnetaquicoccaceae bacterium FCR-1]|uniref:Homoserine dehydrogenase n=1 Tax=Candidatus Magnetaquiglobus chichijimensis TaxID=3141448 RepID=A0ABQ0CAA6_9PROT